MLRILGIKLYEVEEKNPMVLRPYRVHADYNDINNLKEKIDSKPVAKLNTLDVVEAAPNILRLADTPDRVVQIENGWQTPRFIFVIKVEATASNGVDIIRSYIQGYTSHADISYAGTIDPNMKFYINTITSVRLTYDELTGMYNIIPYSAYSVIYDPNGETYRIEQDHEAMRLFRPKDIISDLRLKRVYDVQDGEFLDTSSTVSRIAETSRPDNRNPLDHITKSINAIKSATSMSEPGDGQLDIYDTAISSLLEFKITAEPFISALSAQTGRLTPAIFTFQELNLLDHMVSDKIEVFIKSKQNSTVNGVSLISQEDTEPLLSSLVEVKIGHEFIDAVTGLLLANRLSSVVLHVTNNTVDLVPSTIISSYTTDIDDIDMSGFLKRFVTRLEMEVMPLITNNGQLIVDIHAIIDFQAKSQVQVSINGKPAVPISIPVYADNLYSPVLLPEQTYAVSTSEYQDVIQKISF